MTTKLSRFEKARRMFAKGATTREVSDALKITMASARDAKKHGPRLGRPPAPAHKKRAAKRQLKLAGVSTKRKAAKR